MKKKVILLGDGGTGKTSLVRRFVFNQFDDAYITTIGSKVSSKEVLIRRPESDVELDLMIWDILGREGYASLHARTFAGVHGAILVADLTRKETLLSLEKYWIPLLFKVVECVPLVFVCNKSDLRDSYQFGIDEMRGMSSRYNAGMEDELPSSLAFSYMTSAKTGDNVESAFQSLGHLILSDKLPLDPIKELFESLVAMGIQRQTSKKTTIGALDAILVDFCEEIDDDSRAMSLVRQEVVRAGIDIRNPTREGLIKVVEYLAEAESEFKDQKSVLGSRERRMEWARKAI